MAEKILVQLKRHDQIDDIIPYVEKVAQPGMKVIFLIGYPIEPWLWVRDHWVTTESPREAMLAGRRIMERCSWETQKALAEKKVFPAREALRKRGVEVVVDVYTGRLTEVVRSYTLSGDVHLIMMRARRGLPIMRLLRRAIGLFGLSKRPSFSPVLLLNPDQAVAHS